ncbi:unnamed protein product, partial [Mesorhabditis belari]|uniref:Protein kinase domain-containing protein n=1 Tax=Mesorhabditis belari TaxID=2138241 RepID=A0AAF3ET73_9BILA
MHNPQSQQSVGGSFGGHVNTLQIIRDKQVDRYEIVPGKDPKFSDVILETPNCILSCKKVQGTINKHGEAYSLKWKEELGNGGNGEIWKVEFTSQSSLPREYAAKNTKTREDIYSQNIALNELRHECEILKQLDHAHIVKYMGFAEFQHDQISKRFVLLLEKCDGGDLLTMINDRHKIYSVYTVVYWAEQLFSALEYLRKGNFIHRDIKAENVLLSIKQFLSPNKIEYDVKLCDFAFTIRRENTTFFLMKTSEEFPKGTYASMSPEVYNCMVCHRSDIFCLGLVLWFLIERRKFYSCPSEWKTYQTAKQQEPSFVNCRDDLRNIIYDCTRKKFYNRAQDAEEVRHRLETILQQSALNLSPDLKATSTVSVQMDA